jgi:hypothetical protein
MHYALAGTVDARVRDIQLQVGDRRYTATLADQTIAVAVEPPPPARLTPLGKQRAQQMPERVEIRPYLLTLQPDSLREQDVVTPRFEMRLADGTRRSQDGARLCVSERCGASSRFGRKHKRAFPRERLRAECSVRVGPALRPGQGTRSGREAGQGTGTGAAVRRAREARSAADR